MTVSGLESIINIRATLNKGLTRTLIEAFPKTVAVVILHLDNTDIKWIDPQIVAGFTSGDGSFIVSIRNSKSSQTFAEGGGRVSITFA